MHPPYEQLFIETTLRGLPVPSRYGPTRELLGHSVQYEAGEMISRRGFNESLGFMELMQVLAGVHDPQAIQKVAPNAQLELFTQKMSYGPRLLHQMDLVIWALQDDPNTRQAVAFIGEPDDHPSNDLPCTLTVQFLQREGFLHSIVSMRSWDITRGLSYDIIVQGGLLMAVARCLNAQPGIVQTTAGSMHVYEDQMDKVPTEDRGRRFSFNAHVPRTWEEIQDWARVEVDAARRIPFGIMIEEGTDEDEGTSDGNLERTSERAHTQAD